MRIFNQSRQTVIAARATIADRMGSRMKGLLGRISLERDEALVITRCRSIHMFFMKFSIDAIFIDRNGCVVGLVRNIRPFQVSPCFFKADSVIECCPGVIDQTLTQINDRIILESGI